MEYDHQDVEKVMKHIYHTLTAAIDFFAQVKLYGPKPAGSHPMIDQDLMHLHTSIETEYFGINDLEEIREMEEEKGKEIDRIIQTCFIMGLDPIKVMKENVKEEVEGSEEENEELWNTINESYSLPPGWPLEYPF